MSTFETLSVILSALALFTAIIGTIISNIRIRYTKPKIGEVICYCELCDDDSLHFVMIVQNNCYHTFSIRRIELFSPSTNQRLTATKFVRISNDYGYIEAVNFLLPAFQASILDVWFSPEDASSILNKNAIITLFLPYKAKKRIKMLVVENMDKYYHKI